MVLRSSQAIQSRAVSEAPMGWNLTSLRVPKVRAASHAINLLGWMTRSIELGTYI